jgi:hypothetical protein
VLWHAKHGWCWNVWSVQQDEYIGVFFATLIGDGVILHFVTSKRYIPWHVTLSALKKGVRLVQPYVNVIYTMIEAKNTPILGVAQRLGFRIVEGGEFRRGDKEIFLLKYFERKNDKLSHNQ